MATPELLQDIELPSSISVLGQPVDLTNLKACPLVLVGSERHSVILRCVCTILGGICTSC